ncbi:NADH:flavin oxidoreductase/NADH oxidase family protein [Pseudoalteromonas xiamenensis]|uniref:NADH:flavin oxidoreductase/NADH oxidase family protein n=1 Tax=Pseudoalteromonas xiamenensis TaxID=882626 RepID=UPI0027E4C981|nr:NADH:flavin oxidoreductase/NADH oxidase family protein [Pseudoalteromonas xiamenensis]WMN59981.1 NADH:flavin oxidoreductase/NADH oxidase family protein [Pseudoalteromonas xiamenensis]
MMLFTPFTLPNGTLIKNRIAKAAMEENLADENNLPSNELFNLYGAWAEGGSGLIISGNVMIDKRAMTGPAGVVLDSEKQLEKFKIWAKIGKSNGAQFWLQINHPGRQMPASLGQKTFAPSAIEMDLGKLSKHFGVPYEMTEADIQDVLSRFVQTAKLAQQAGFDGVEIHAAHGYLLSQFLSPKTNQRQDKWGGDLANRARLLIEVVKQVRAKVGPSFAVAVKLNSADFQRGGFTTEDAKQVVKWLNDLNVDLVELSGGSYEAPVMQGQSRDGQSLAREAYFLEFAKQIRLVANMPLMVTGGIKRKPVADHVLESNIDLVGLATALALEPNLPNKWQQGDMVTPNLPNITWKNKVMASLANMARVKYQLNQLSKLRAVQPNVHPLWALIKQQLRDRQRAKLYRKVMGENRRNNQ